MRKVFLSVCVLVVFLVVGFGFGSQPAQSQDGRQGQYEKVAAICGGQSAFTTSAPYPGTVVNTVTFDLADVGAFPGDGGSYLVDILFSSEANVSTAGTYSGVSFQLDGGLAINSGPQYFDNSVGPGFGVRTTNNSFFFGTAFGTAHTVDVTFYKISGTGSVTVFWRCTRADYSSLQS